MDSIPTEPAFTNHCAIGVTTSQVDTPSWLATLLATYQTQADPLALTSECEIRLKQISFEAIVTAIEVARSSLTGLAGHAEVRLYQDWIAGNAGGNQHLFAAWFNLGVALAREGDRARAVVAYRNARRLKADFCPAAVNLGLMLEAIGQTDAALLAWEDAIQTDEARTTLLNQSGRLMENLGRLDKAETVLHTSLLTNSSQPDVLQHWLHIRQKMCQWPVLTTDISGLTAAELLRHSGPLGILALTDDVSLQREVTAAWIERKMPPAPTRLSLPEGYRHARIRVGYLSSDFCRHAMSFLIAELFERHDRSRFEIFGYCSTLEDGSDIRQRVIAAFDHHRVIRDFSDEQAAQLIRDDEIDILIDLNGLTARTRLAILRWRPAPIQATYLGFIGPVPLPELDYLLCDDFVIPSDQVAAYRPAPLSIARSYQANDSKRAIGRPLSRQDIGLPNNCFVFCCFSNHYKITEAMFVAWMSILRKVDSSVLWLTVDNAWSQANLHARAEREGIAPGRILFADRTSPELYMSRLGLADLFLDTFPYNAGTVASDAIRMQLPLLTLSGASFASRMAGSLLNVIGAQQGITTSLSEYVATAIMLATDTNAYANYKQHFNGDAWKNTAGDIGRFTSEFEATLARLMATRGSTSVHHTKTLDCLEQPGMITPELAIADKPRSENDDPEGIDINCFKSIDLMLVDLVAEAEIMIAGGQVERALRFYEAWLQHHPADPLRHLVHFNHGSLLLQTGHLTRAAQAFAEVTQIEPGFLPAYINAGLTFERLGDLDQAVGQWIQVVDCLAPINGDCIRHKTTALKHLARLYKSAGDVRSAEEAMRRCIDIDPHQRDAIQHWIAMREMQCKWPVIASTEKLTRSSLMAALAPLALAIHTDDPMFQTANAWRSFKRDVIRSPGPHTVGRWLPPAMPVKRPLRIGYVSPDLREHAIGFLTAELFELHDRTKVEVFGYYSGREKSDAMQVRIRQTIDHWTAIFGWSDKQIARRIVNDEIDILVDLGGHTGDAPTAAFALRPAPVIVNWLGYPGSMGTPHHQYIIADETIIPSSHEKYYSERVLRLPCYQPTDRKRIVGESPSRRDVDLPDDAMVYCCFNGTQKITPVMFRRWMAILARVPNAVLWLLSCDAATDERLRQQAGRYGISPERLVFAARKLNAEHLARYPLADLFLDTAPYGAHTTASDALWMGIPVLTIAGLSFASRVCASLVIAAGLAELACDGTQAYEDYAVKLGTQPETLLAFRGRLQAVRDCCTLFNMPLLVARLETLYKQMWDEYLSGQIPEPDLANFAIYNEIGSEFDHEMDEVLDLQTYERKYTTALAYYNSLSPIAPDRRLWTGSR